MKTHLLPIRKTTDRPMFWCYRFVTFICNNSSGCGHTTNLTVLVCREGNVLICQEDSASRKTIFTNRAVNDFINRIYIIQTGSGINSDCRNIIYKHRIGWRNSQRSSRAAVRISLPLTGRVLILPVRYSRVGNNSRQSNRSRGDCTFIVNFKCLCSCDLNRLNIHGCSSQSERYFFSYCRSRSGSRIRICNITNIRQVTGCNITKEVLCYSQHSSIRCYRFTGHKICFTGSSRFTFPYYGQCT